MKRCLSKRTTGYFTVEAALLLPFVMMSIVFMIFLSFYCYDRCILEQCAYAAAKEGIRGLSRVAATEWGKDGINVNVVCPLAWTAQLEQFQTAYPEAFEKNVHMPPMGHFADPETEIGRVCVQLAHPDFKYLTGETLTLEGGLGLRP